MARAGPVFRSIQYLKLVKMKNPREPRRLYLEISTSVCILVYSSTCLGVPNEGKLDEICKLSTSSELVSRGQTPPLLISDGPTLWVQPRGGWTWASWSRD